MKKEKEKKVKAEAAEKKKSDVSSHKDPPKDEDGKNKKKRSKILKESSGKNGSKDAAVGMGMSQGECELKGLNRTKMDLDEGVRRTTGSGSEDHNKFEKYYTASPSTPSETSTNIPSDDDGQEFLNDWDEWSEHEVGNGPKARWEDIHYDFNTGKMSLLLMLHQRLIPQVTPMASPRSTTS